MNNFDAIGRLTAEPVLKETKNGKKFVQYQVAIPRKFKRNEADFADCMAWNKAAEYLAKYGKKGMVIVIDSAQLNTNITDEKKYTNFITNSIQLMFDKEEKNSEENVKKTSDKKTEKEPQELFDDERPF